ncbi:NAD(P)-dependent oxidoreductase [Brochothrix thermosphacta]|uniref:NAD(P)-dependent oxidoreductase n=1 Tax=Brochothrix thermosphacta TaxID=2756 RepID=UPI003F9BF147
MKIGIIGAAGQSGVLLVEEALKQGHEVTAIVRDSNKVSNKEVAIIEKDLFALELVDLVDFDVVIDAFGAWGENIPLHITSLKHLRSILKGHKTTRLVVIGSAGSLLLDDNGKRLIDSPDMPAEFKPLATVMAQAYDELKGDSEVNWTYVSPPPVFIVEAPLTNNVQLGDDYLMVNAQGEAKLSYADLAVVVIAELQTANYLNKRMSIIEK